MPVLHKGCRVLVVLTMLGLSACGWVRDSASDYRRDRELPPLQVPADLDGSRIQSFYAVPPVQGDAVPAWTDLPRPETLARSEDDQAARIQKLGQDQWALVQLAPDQVWPLLKGLLQSNRISLAREDAAQGLMLTDWLSVEGRDRQERYWLRVDAGVQRNTTELHVRQQLRNPDADTLSWPARSDDGQREYTLLYEAAGHLADQKETASVSLMAQGIRTASKVSLQQRADEEPWLLLELPYDRAWGSLGVALTKAGFETVDRHHSDGVYFVRPPHLKNEDKPGFWARLFGAGGAEKETTLDRQWQVSLKAQDEARMAIHLQGSSPREPDAATRLRYLNLIRAHLN